MSDALIEWLLRPLTYLFELAFRALCYPIGWPIVRLLTWGRYPQRGMWMSHKPEAEWTSGVGVTVLLIAMMAVLQQFVW